MDRPIKPEMRGSKIAMLCNEIKGLGSNMCKRVIDRGGRAHAHKWAKPLYKILDTVSR